MTTTTDKLYELTASRSEGYSKLSGSLAGHIMNAICDLETGTKEDALRTLRAGLKVYDDHLAPTRALMEAVKADAA